MSNEENLLNKIKSLESEEAYGRTEVDHVLARERELTETNQRLQYRVECLEGKLRQKNKAGKVSFTIYVDRFSNFPISSSFQLVESYSLLTFV